VTVLDSLSHHRSTIQKCLYFLEQLVGRLAPIDILVEKAELHQQVRQVYAEQGGGLIRQLLANLADEMPQLMNLKVANILYLSMERFPELTQAWIEKGLMSDYFQASAPHLTEDDKRLFLSLAWPLRQNKYQWKAIWVQFNAICLKNDNMESLLAFQLVGPTNGKLRGSPQQDAAFETL
jgi:hypothetical protein